MRVFIKEVILMNKTSESFSRYNEYVLKLLETEFPESLIQALITAAERFDVDIEKIPKMLSPTFKDQLRTEYNIGRDELSAMEDLI